MKKLNIFNLFFDVILFEDLYKKIVNRNICSLQIVVTPNVDHIVRCYRDHHFLSIYKTADITVCDSRILRSYIRLARRIDIDLISGSDLTKKIIRNLKQSDTVTVLGCNEKIIKKVQEKYQIRKLYHYNPPMGFIKDDYEVDRCLDFVKKNISDYLFICVGSPQQEILAFTIKRRLNIKGYCFCVGASLLFLSGEEKRAPIWIQELSLEWLYRLIQNPKRLFKRYLVDDLYILKVFFKDIRETIRKKLK
ncbi:WecB/TagA/CpsF family glycosyltransferase [Endozoicomonas sp. Mp262]|uniref:WecB/TagA/CpsF family glycosyltransferase n=1 Tax=Endozoicomonas sp. Mp262 TaxID=2919499 RepID=UPI0021D80C66